MYLQKISSTAIETLYQRNIIRKLVKRFKNLCLISFRLLVPMTYKVLYMRFIERKACLTKKKNQQ